MGKFFSFSWANNSLIRAMLYLRYNLISKWRCQADSWYIKQVLRKTRTMRFKSCYIDYIKVMGLCAITQLCKYRKGDCKGVLNKIKEKSWEVMSYMPVEREEVVSQWNATEWSRKLSARKLPLDKAIIAISTFVLFCFLKLAV